MSNPRHKDDTKTFEKLAYEEQANSINATIINLHNEIKRHVKDSPNQIKTLEKCIEQISGFCSFPNSRLGTHCPRNSVSRICIREYREKWFGEDS